MEATDFFDLLGLPPGLMIDGSDLERRYHAAAFNVHPDRHHTSDPRTQQLSTTASAALNRAYRTLRDPIARGKYWLERHGVHLNDDNRVPASLAALVFDVQEQLDDFRQAGDDAGTKRAQVTAVQATLEARLSTIQDALAAKYRDWSPSAAAEPAVLTDLQRHLAEINYLRTLLGDVEEALGEPRGTDRRH